MCSGIPELLARRSSPDLAVTSALSFWLHAVNLRPLVKRVPCDLILADKLVYVCVAKRKTELWKHRADQMLLQQLPVGTEIHRALP